MSHSPDWWFRIKYILGLFYKNWDYGGFSEELVGVDQGKYETFKKSSKTIDTLQEKSLKLHFNIRKIQKSCATPVPVAYKKGGKRRIRGE